MASYPDANEQHAQAALKLCTLSFWKVQNDCMHVEDGDAIMSCPELRR
jgi:hypothetical protein